MPSTRCRTSGPVCFEVSHLILTVPATRKRNEGLEGDVVSFLRWILPATLGGFRNQESRQVRLGTGGRYSEGRRGRKALAAASLVGSDGSASSRLIAGTEAFLSGDYANHLHRHSDRIPGWARLNTLAHGDIDSLRRAEQSPSAGKPTSLADLTDDSWRSALRILARELNQLVREDSDLLTHLQQHALVPLEFRLMCEGSLTAFELVQLTRAAVRSSIS